ncbi:MAG: hypothetical protein COV36_00515 [Alphaproteobacteria bacterium CG11_big_fil_rev_8_21_14_0_20_44_7]|nr:MAG: hypothetical protein COV36_00515 [Alphaproteobacteria bacterium CG11_big_fil_rev_8_21_14_0_20_44_7]
MGYSEPVKDALIKLCEQAFLHSIEHNAELEDIPKREEFADLPIQASFISVDFKDKFISCYGTIWKEKKLHLDIVKNSHTAVRNTKIYQDMTPEKFRRLKISIYLLSELTELSFSDEKDMISQLKPGVDGVVFQWGKVYRTYLPVVWENTPNPQDFIAGLKRKANLPNDIWDSSVKVWTYTTENLIRPPSLN